MNYVMEIYGDYFVFQIRVCTFRTAYGKNTTLAYTCFDERQLIMFLS